MVTATILDTQLGQIAAEVLGRRTAKAPLLVRMERFTHRVALLVAVEALDSCTCIATDKTGTLTENRLTVRRILFPRSEPWEVTGESLKPEGGIVTPRGAPAPEEHALLARLCRVAVPANEGLLSHRDGDRVHQSDAVDTALLVLAHNAGVIQAETMNAFPEVAAIPFESERQFSASLNEIDGRRLVFVKGALKRLLPMYGRMATPAGETDIDAALLEREAEELAGLGYRVIALADGETVAGSDAPLSEEHLSGLTLISLVGLIDPLRPEAKPAVAACRELGLVEHIGQVVTGPLLKQAGNDDELDRLVRRVRVFARMEPKQKLDIVHALQRNGHFVAVSGDGANDVPALRAAQVGATMGRSGTDVARETSGLIITDDNFAPFVAGVEEGRAAYANVRKVIFLLISTGAAELVLFTLALLTGLPLALLAVMELQKALWYRLAEKKKNKRPKPNSSPLGIACCEIFPPTAAGWAL